MVARNVYEIRRTHGPLVAFRTIDSDEVAPNRPDRVVLVMVHPNDAEQYLTGEEVEGLHQFTYEVLAGRTGDPRLVPSRVFDLCGYEWYSNAAGKPVTCCLNFGHPAPSSLLHHIAADGTAFTEPPF